MDWIRIISSATAFLSLSVLSGRSETSDSNPPPPATEQLVINRTGPSEVNVTRDGVPVPSGEIHVEVIPTDLTSAPDPDTPVSGTDRESKSPPRPETPPPSSSGRPPMLKSLDNPPTPPSESESKSGEGHPLKLELRELIELRHAAQEAGGDLEISIRPIHITSEDLIVPLARNGFFEVKSDEKQGCILVRSKARDPYVEQLRQEIDRLERRRRALLNDISFLENSHPQPPGNYVSPVGGFTNATLSPPSQP